MMKNKYNQPTLGLLAHPFCDEYGVTVGEGIKKAIEEYGYNLICFVGGSLNNPYFDYSAKNTVYDLVSMSNVDGIMAISSSIGSYINIKELYAFFHSFQSIPVISIGIPLKDIPSVLIDNKKGMYDLMNHLINVHGYRRIALIRGPENNKDAEVRYTVYKNALIQNNIPVDPALIVKGSFHANCGPHAISYLLDDKKVSFDALVGSNDYVAIKAIHEIQRRGIRVPEDIAVVGFDNVLESQLIEPTLTTIHQPFFHLGYTATIAMFSLLDKNIASTRKEIPSHLVIRRSCGCSNVRKSDYIDKNIELYTSGKQGNEYFLKAIENIMGIEFTNVPTSTHLHKWAEDLFMSLIKDITESKCGKFLSVLENLVNKTLINTSHIDSWHIILHLLFDEALLKLNIKKKEKLLISLLTSALKLVSNVAIRNLKNSLIKTHEYDMYSNSITKMLRTVLEVKQLKEIIMREFPLLGIKSCYISVYNKNKYNSRGRYSEIIVAYDNYKYIEFSDNEKIYPSEELIPGGVKTKQARDTLYLLALYYQREVLGNVLYEIESHGIIQSDSNIKRIRILCEILTVELSSTVKSILLFNQAEKQTSNIVNKDAGNHLKQKYHVLPEEKSKSYYKKLLLYMENEEPFIDSELSLHYLAEQLEIPRNSLSSVINEYSGVNFYDFINSYRIEKAKLYLKTGKNIKINMLTIAFDSGFRSKSTFYKFFKKFTQMTPTNYRNTYLDS